MQLPFANRREAGKLLAMCLTDLHDHDDLVVLGLPRGGVPVAYEVALALGAPLDVFIVRKLGLPGQEELAMGAIASGDVQILNQTVIQRDAVSQEDIATVAAQENAELRRRERLYRGDAAPPDVRNRTVLLVDDGLATGTTMQAAVQAVRQLAPRSVIVAVPVGAPDSCRALADVADRVMCVHTPAGFSALGLWYDDFRQTSDGEVRSLLAAAASPGTVREEERHPAPGRCSYLELTERRQTDR